MKTLLYKKFTIVLTTIVLCVTILRAQIPEQLKNYPPFKLRASILSSLHKPHAQGKLNTMHCSANAYCLKAQTTLGGSGDDLGYAITPTFDGGFIVAGSTNSADGDFSVPAANGEDGYIAKYNRFKKLEWTKTYGGTGDDFLQSIAQTFDGGYIVVGSTSSNDGDVSGNHNTDGGYDVWVVKTNRLGKIEWQKCLGGTGEEFGQGVIQTFYGGYGIASATNSNDGNVSGNHNMDGGYDGWFVQLGIKGNLLFQNCYGGSSDDGLNALVQSDFGSFILLGGTNSNDGDVSGNHGNGDAWAIKVNVFGKVMWEKTVGGSNFESVGFNELVKTKDGNVVINGYTNSVDGDMNSTNDLAASFLTKLSSKTGEIIWSKAYAVPSLRGGGGGVFATRDGGTVETGNVAPDFDGSAYDVLIAKYDKNGNEEWYKRLGGSDYDNGYIGYEDFNGDLNILCQTISTDGDVKNNHGGVDTWIIKLGHCENYITDDVTSTDNATAATKNSTTTLSAYPNPVLNSATISFNLQQSQKVSIQIFDMNGRLVKTLADEQMQQGTHQLIWNARDEKGSAVGSGVYLLKLQAGNYTETKKISVVH